MSQIGITVGNAMYPVWIQKLQFRWEPDPRFSSVPLVYDPSAPLPSEVIRSVVIIDLELATDDVKPHVIDALKAAYHGYAPPLGRGERPEPPPNRMSRDIPRHELVAMVGKLRNALQEVVHDPNHTDWDELEHVMAWTHFQDVEEPEPERELVPSIPAELF